MIDFDLFHIYKMKKVLKIFGYIIGSILLLVIGLLIFLTSNPGQDFLTKQVNNFLGGKIKTPYHIGKIKYKIPTSIGLEEVYIEDQNTDTLAYIHNLEIGLGMWGLIKSDINVNKLILDDANFYMHRQGTDTFYNYQFIVDAFVSKASNDTLEIVTDTKDTTSKPLQLSVGNIELNNIRFRFHDEPGGTDFAVRAKTLKLIPESIDLDQLAFEVKELLLDGVQTSLTMQQSIFPPEPDTSTTSTPLILKVKDIKLNNVSYVMEDKTSPMYMDVKVGKLDGNIPLFDLEQMLIDVSKIGLEESDVKIVFGKKDNTQKPILTQEEVATAIDTSSWTILASEILFKNVNFSLDDINVTKLAQGIDYSHLDADNINLRGINLKYTADSIAGEIKQLTLKEQSGLDLQEFRTNFVYHNKGAILRDLYLKTPQTLLQDQLEVGYASLDDLSNNLGRTTLNINLNQSQVGINDVLIFMPAEQRSMLTPYRNQFLKITTNINGALNKLNINNLFLAGLSGTSINLNGQLTGLPDADKLNYNFNIKHLETVKKDIQPFLTPEIEQQINLPNFIAINGKVHGDIYAYNPNLNLITSDGNATIQGVVDIRQTNNEKYDLLVNAQQLNLGKILRQDSLMGHITTAIKVKGSSFDIKKMNANFDLDLSQAYLMGYNYTKIKANGYLENNFAIIKAIANDPNAKFNLDAKVDLKNEHPAVQADLDLETLDLQALKFVEDTMKFNGYLVLDIPILNPDYPVGNIYGSEFEVTLPGNKLPIDSIVIEANSSLENGQDIKADIAKIINLDLTGNIPLTQVGNAAMEHINRHYFIADSLASAGQYDMNLEMHIRYNPILTRYDWNIKPFDTIKLNAALDPVTMKIDGYIPKFIYGTNRIDSTVINIQEDPQNFVYGLNMKSLQSGTTFKFYQPTIAGNINNDTINANISISDSTITEQFAINASMFQENSNSLNQTNIRLNNGLKFNYDEWNVNNQNLIAFNDLGIHISNFNLSQGQQAINVNSESAAFNSPLDVNISNFELSNLTNIISGDTLLADGLLNAKVNLDMDPKGPFIDATAAVDNLKVFDVPFGKLEIAAHNVSAQLYDASLTLTGNDNNVNIAGQYNLESTTNNLDFKVNLAPLALRSIDGLTFGNLKNSSGNLTGMLNITGTPSAPLINGTLTTDNMQTTVSMLDATFRMPKEQIEFNRNGINFKDFKIYDQQNQYADIAGMVRTKNYVDYILNLNINAQKWNPISSTQKDYEMLYGDLILSANLSAKGPMTAPNLEGSVTVHDDTELSFALLDDDPQLVETDGVVKFIDSRYPDMLDMDSLEKAMTAIRFSKTAQMNINLNVEKDATFNLVIDPSTGDNLQVKGEAALNAQILPDGTIGLVGTYEIEDGYYELSFPPVRRRFKIDKGSTITLAGDPLDAIVNITARYSQNVAPYDLMQTQITDPEELVYYKQRVPTDVILKLNGKAMQPDIAFDIQIPEDKEYVADATRITNVKNRLAILRNNPSDINKQVFGIIVLGRYIAEDPFSSGGGVNVEQIARQSVSRFLSTQLNNLAGQFITGLELNMDLESNEDYTTGQKVNRTDLNISATKNLMDDRLSVTVGNDFLLEGATAQTQRQTSVIPGNLSADYKITKDGRYQVRAYRKNELQNIIDGYVVETGLGFRFNVQYNRFRTIFMNEEQLRNYYRKLREKRTQQQLKSDSTTGYLYKPLNKELDLNRSFPSIFTKLIAE